MPAAGPEADERARRVRTVGCGPSSRRTSNSSCCATSSRPWLDSINVRNFGHRPERMAPFTRLARGARQLARPRAEYWRVLVDGSEGVPEVEVRDLATEDNAGDT